MTETTYTQCMTTALSAGMAMGVLLSKSSDVAVENDIERVNSELAKNFSDCFDRTNPEEHGAQNSMRDLLREIVERHVNK